jgi:hypothetical protein
MGAPMDEAVLPRSYSYAYPVRLAAAAAVNVMCMSSFYLNHKEWSPLSSIPLRNIRYFYPRLDVNFIQRKVPNLCSFPIF